MKKQKWRHARRKEAANDNYAINFVTSLVILYIIIIIIINSPLLNLHQLLMLFAWAWKYSEPGTFSSIIIIICYYYYDDDDYYYYYYYYYVDVELVHK
jgi:hypothetical protein